MVRKLGFSLVALTLAGCAASGPAASPPVSPSVPSGTSPAVASSPVMVTPAASPDPRRKPRCGGDGVPGDLDGDGYADLAFVWRGATGESLRRGQLVVVRGSPRGLDLSTARLVGDGSMSGDAVPQLADLDGDGCADVVIRDASLSIFWGGRAPATVLASDGGTGVADLDGDDAVDLMAVDRGDGADGARLVLLHGPFTRSGRPARETSRPLPAGEWPGRLITDPHGPGAVLYGPEDGEQARAWLLAGGELREVATGSSAVFGDFDGDGRRDVAIGDSGSRNDEPGHETEAPSVDGVTRVFYGRGGDPQVLTGLRGSLASGDLDGDGRDDLVSGEVAASAGATGRAEILAGSARGLRRPGLVVTHRGPDRTPDGKRLKEWQSGAVTTWSVADHDGDGRAELLRVWRGDLGFARFWRVDAGGRTLQTFDLAGRGEERRDRAGGIRQ
ncbi:FG-GAP repeat protein [Nonomuraea coxensis DSM 45129]|uniref:FG-GAP repeat protein n=1 Tax=Nonomuraea coxensis DSM 45129 TaxID=1122611 RepID=A0ABX8U417_9ACTN|nr:VCBS repeat-containing protein [Nonomuraea coxensis]QYC42482.1 FG-GAP repeat protein [Nonomuraea coxensis DSM 45129]